MNLQAAGIGVTLPPGWEGSIQPGDQRALDSASRSATVEPDTVHRPVMHLANFALPAQVDDFGAGATERMQAGECFVSLVEYGPTEVDTALFARGTVRRSLAQADLSPTSLLRTLPDHLGHQSFATEAGRAFCLYVVVVGEAVRGATLREVNRALASLRLDR